jgi:hypothetical protein
MFLGPSLQQLSVSCRTKDETVDALFAGHLKHKEPFFELKSKKGLMNTCCVTVHRESL